MKLSLIENDPEANFFIRNFNQKPPAKVLEVGSADNKVACMLASAGFDVVGIDLRPYAFKHKHKHIVGNFLNMPAEFWEEYRGKFDVVFSISAIEHFGLGTYGEVGGFPLADVVAVRYIHDLLKVGGTCYLTVPYGGRFVTVGPHWRVYDWETVQDRLVQDFKLEWWAVQCSEAFETYTACEAVSDRVPLKLMNGQPYCSIILKMVKVS